MHTSSKLDFNKRPYIAIWETTQACDLACVHCRACAQPLRKRDELTTEEAKRLIDEIAAMGVPVFVLSGGDPLKRPDIYELVEYASARRVHTSMTPSATPLLTEEALAGLKERGLARLAVSLDGSTAEIHDAFRRVSGSYRWTLNAVQWAGKLGLPVQINTTMTRRNLGDFDAMRSLLETLDIVLWSVFFLVPTGRGSTEDLLTAVEFEAVFEKLYAATKRVGSTSRRPKRNTIADSSYSGVRKSGETGALPEERPCLPRKIFQQRWAATALRAHRAD